MAWLITSLSYVSPFACNKAVIHEGAISRYCLHKWYSYLPDHSSQKQGYHPYPTFLFVLFYTKEAPTRLWISAPLGMLVRL